MSTFTRYLLFQIPGWVITVALLAALRTWFDLSPWACVAIFALLVIKDFALYPVLKVAYGPGPGHGMERLIGETAVVRRELQPEGYVRVHNELWRARASAEGLHFPEGARVRIAGTDAMTLLVEPLEEFKKESA